jgi:hypothetical protein
MRKSHAARARRRPADVLLWGSHSDQRAEVEMNLVHSWSCTRETKSGEPVLVLRTLDGREIVFMLPSIAAEQLGRALVAQGRATAPAGLLN